MLLRPGHYRVVIVDQAGNLYSTTVYGGTFNYGTVFKLTQSNDGSWKETVLHSFEFDGKDGYYPETRLAFDSAGSLYGTTHDGGAYTAGTVFKLTMNVDGKWNERVLHSFSNGSGDGYGLYAGLVFDRTGNLYGATALGGAYGYGAIFRLKPTAKGGWKETLLHSFRDKPGAYPQGELLFDGNENLYGTTGGDLVNTLGSVFEVTP